MSKAERILEYCKPEKHRLSLPDLPESAWCDFRRDYASGMTLKAISEKYFCDPRTVRRCLILNKDSKDLGRQGAPTILEPYVPLITSLWEAQDKCTGICHSSREITDQLRKTGYTGTERTVRNYIRSRYFAKKHD